MKVVHASFLREVGVEIDAGKRRVDFLVEVKSTERTLSPFLKHFQGETKAAHAFQVVLGLPFENVDCFRTHLPTVVPARTFLSQLP